MESPGSGGSAHSPDAEAQPYLGQLVECIEHVPGLRSILRDGRFRSDIASLTPPDGDPLVTSVDGGAEPVLELRAERASNESGGVLLVTHHDGSRVSHTGRLYTEVIQAIYLDHAATTPLRPAVREAILPWLTGAFGNPSSVHVQGRRARAAVDEARDRVAAATASAPREVLITSGGTEADNLALRGALDRWGAERGRHLVVSAIEHEAILTTAQRLAESGRAELTVVEADRRGRIHPDAVAAAVRTDTVVVSVMLANNEIGTVQDISAIAEAVRRRNPRTLIHCDAVQGLGRLPVGLGATGADLITLSAHKAGGPQGVGALLVRNGVFLAAQMTGGGQERDLRSGTENVAGVVGMGVAASVAEEARPREGARLVGMAQRLTERLTAAVVGAEATGDPLQRLPGLASFVIPGCRSDLLLTVLDELGLCASAGSACSSGAPVASHVLAAMGYGELAGSALRLSLGWTTTDDDVDRAVAIVARAVQRVRAAGELTVPRRDGAEYQAAAR